MRPPHPIPPVFRPSPRAIAAQVSIGVLWGLVLLGVIMWKFPHLNTPVAAWRDGGNLVLLFNLRIVPVALLLGGLLVPIMIYPPLAHLVAAPRLFLGLYKAHAGAHEAAIEDYKAAAAFFERHPFVDRHRAWVLLSLSRYGLREMALMCIAHSHLQTGNATASVAVWREVAQAFPGNTLARDALLLADAAHAAPAAANARAQGFRGAS